MTPSFEMFDLDGPGRMIYEKPKTNHWEKAEVLITVKAAPQLSRAHGDTVCVAGIRMTETGPEWVRLYPVPFRSMDAYSQFSKYEIVKLPIKPNRKDFRSESFTPDRDKIQIEGKLDKWSARHRYVSPLADRFSMCAILDNLRSKKPYPSLAVIRPQIVEDMLIERSGGWTAEQLDRMKHSLQQDDLFGNAVSEYPLEPPRFVCKYVYRCEHPNCNGHTQTMIDWELSEFIRSHYRYKSDEDTISGIRQRFLHEMCNSKNGPLFFVGNLIATPAAFNVLGVYRSIAP